MLILFKQLLKFRCGDPNNPSVIIEKCPVSFVPKGGGDKNYVQITARLIIPNVKGKFKFELFDVSSEPGFCINAPKFPPEVGLNSNSWKDLQFSDNSSFQIFGDDKAEAVSVSSNLTEATIKIDSYDYGSFGRLAVTVIIGDDGKTYYGFSDGFPFICIPLDDNNNLIADGAQQDNEDHGSYNFEDKADDHDSTPLGNGEDGDGLSRYEEYRGLMIGGQHTRTDVNTKDTFFFYGGIYNNIGGYSVLDGNPTGHFTSSNVGSPIHVLSIDEIEWEIGGNFVTDASGEDSGGRNINFNNKTAHIQDCRVIRFSAKMCDEKELAGATWKKGGKSTSYYSTWSFVCMNFFDDYKLLKNNISADDTEIRLDNSFEEGAWRFRKQGGAFRIGDEVITYSGVAPDLTLTGCQRGAAGTSKSSHTVLEEVIPFADKPDAVFHNVAHECGHQIGIDFHPPYSHKNVMSKKDLSSGNHGWLGSYEGNGYFNKFNPANGVSIQDKFIINKK